MTVPEVVRAAGCVVWRCGSSEPELLLVHRPRWSDWSYPKGKLDRGELSVAAAVRETWEETGLRVRLGPRLPDQHYPVADGAQTKHVAYWTAQPPKHADITHYEPNDEIDALRWVPVSRAGRELTYPRDAQLLSDFAGAGFDSRPLLIVRHAEARSRGSWRGDDSERSLRAIGTLQARGLVPLLAAYGVSRVVTSDAARCVATVLPYVNSGRVTLRLDSAMTEEDASADRVARRVKRWLHSDKRIAVCSHRPVLPMIFEAMGVDSIGLAPSGVVVVHRRHGAVVDLEQHG